MTKLWYSGFLNSTHYLVSKSIKIIPFSSNLDARSRHMCQVCQGKYMKYVEINKLNQFVKLIFIETGLCQDHRERVRMWAWFQRWGKKCSGRVATHKTGATTNTGDRGPNSPFMGLKVSTSNSVLVPVFSWEGFVKKRCSGSEVNEAKRLRLLPALRSVCLQKGSKHGSFHTRSGW